MSYLFYIDEKANTVLHPDCYKLYPAFEKLSEKEILWMVLAYDYHSPYRQFPERDRVRRAMFHVFDDAMPELLSDQKILAAIEAYKGLQYDENIEQVKSFKKTIESYLSGLDTDDSPSSVSKKLSVISELRGEIRKIENEIIDKAQLKGQIRGKKTLSWFEDLSRNEKLYKAVTQKKYVE